MSTAFANILSYILMNSELSFFILSFFSPHGGFLSRKYQIIRHMKSFDGALLNASKIRLKIAKLI
jgi:hypothetical protein